MSKEVVVGLHFYQPPRNATHPSLADISTDPNGINWTEKIARQSYWPLTENGVLKKATYDVYQSLLLQLDKIDDRISSVLRLRLKENGIGDTFIHPILPDLSDDDKDIVIIAGLEQYMKITDQHPKYIWLPETAVDMATLERLSHFGYEGFICAAEQVKQANGSNSDNTPTIIDLPSGAHITAIPFHREVSQKLGFDPKYNADFFTNAYFVPATRNLRPDQLMVAWTDGETFGHHSPGGDRFLDYLLQTSLPSAGLYPVSLRQIMIDRTHLPHGRLVERSAWSCPHGDLVRWSGVCNCEKGDASWKHPFYDAMGKLNYQIGTMVKDLLGKHYTEIIGSRFHEINTHPENIQTPQDALIAAKVSSLTARTSCATFFVSPEVSGRINLLFAYQACQYLRQAGLEKQADWVCGQLYSNLNNVHYPYSQRTAFSTLEQMLNQ